GGGACLGYLPPCGGGRPPKAGGRGVSFVTSSRTISPPSLTLPHKGGGNRLRSEATQQETFAANRATGRIEVAVAADGGRTCRTRVHEDGSLRIRFPNVT